MENPRGAEQDAAAALAELVAATEGVQPWRRVLHATTGLVLALGPLALELERIETVAILASLLVVQIAFDIVRFRVAAVQVFFFRWARVLVSPREAERAASSTWYTLGGLLAWGIFPTGIAPPAILVLALADPAASTVGRIWGRRKFGKGSVEGSLTFFAIAAAILLVAVDWPAALFAATAATLMEVVPGIGDDNLVVPMATGGALWLVLSLPI